MAAIEFEQPYNTGRRTSAVGPGSMEALQVLSSLQNADKHRSLAVLVPGLSHFTAQASWGHERTGIMKPAYVEAGAEVLRSDELGNRIAYKDVRVEVSGISRVSVMVGDRPDPYELLDVAGGILGRVRDRIIPTSSRTPVLSWVYASASRGSWHRLDVTSSALGEQATSLEAEQDADPGDGQHIAERCCQADINDVGNSVELLAVQ